MSVPKIFISYSRKDEVWREYFTDYLAPVCQTDKISLWYDMLIVTGGQFDEQIFAALNSSDAALLLVSPAFLASNFISTKELPRILERSRDDGMEIFPVLVADCLWRWTDLANFQFAHDVAKPLLYLTPAELNKQLARICNQLINRVMKDK